MLFEDSLFVYTLGKHFDKFRGTQSDFRFGMPTLLYTRYFKVWIFPTIIIEFNIYLVWISPTTNICHWKYQVQLFTITVVFKSH